MSITSNRLQKPSSSFSSSCHLCQCWARQLVHQIESGLNKHSTEIWLVAMHDTCQASMYLYTRCCILEKHENRENLVCRNESQLGTLKHDNRENLVCRNESQLGTLKHDNRENLVCRNESQLGTLKHDNRENLVSRNESQLGTLKHENRENLVCRNEA
jgi:hypothetical protein